MNSVSDLLLLDEKAREIKGDAQNYYDNTMQKITIEKDSILSGLNAHAKSRIDNVFETEKEIATENIQKINAKYAKLEDELIAKFEKGKSNWEEALFQRCVGGDTYELR